MHADPVAFGVQQDCGCAVIMTLGRQIQSLEIECHPQEEPVVGFLVIASEIISGLKPFLGERRYHLLLMLQVVELLDSLPADQHQCQCPGLCLARLSFSQQPAGKIFLYLFTK